MPGTQQKPVKKKKEQFAEQDRPIKEIAQRSFDGIVFHYLIVIGNSGFVLGRRRNVQILEDLIHLFHIIKGIVQIKKQFGDDTGLVTDTIAQMPADFMHVFITVLDDKGWGGMLKHAQMDAGNTQIG
jgi:hypothetical protein